MWSKQPPSRRGGPNPGPRRPRGKRSVKMKWFYDMKIGLKLQFSFILVAAIAGIIGWIGFSHVGRMQEATSALYSRRLLPVLDLTYADFAFAAQRIDQRQMLITNDRNQRRDLAADIDAQTTVINQRLDAYSKMCTRKEEQELLAKV